jgi:hypothetical protein
MKFERNLNEFQNLWEYQNLNTNQNLNEFWTFLKNIVKIKTKTTKLKKKKLENNTEEEKRKKRCEQVGVAGRPTPGRGCAPPHTHRPGRCIRFSTVNVPRLFEHSARVMYWHRPSAHQRRSSNNALVFLRKLYLSPIAGAIHSRVKRGKEWATRVSGRNWGFFL